LTVFISRTVLAKRALFCLISALVLCLPFEAASAGEAVAAQSLHSAHDLTAPSTFPATNAGAGTADTTVDNASVPYHSRKPADRPQSGRGGDSDPARSSRSSRWNFSAEAVLLDRQGSAKQTLVSLAPGTYSFGEVSDIAGTQVLNSTDLDHGFSPGFRLSAAYQGDSRYGLELSFLRVANWDASRTFPTGNPPNWLMMRAPGFFQTQDYTYQSMTWGYSSKLYNVEFNLRYNLSNRITLLGGFGWFRLSENLQGLISPIDRFIPLWMYNPQNTLYTARQVEKSGGGTPFPAPFTPCFWNTSVVNNLYGLQVGADAILFEHGRSSLDGLVKLGGYLNNAEESTGVRMTKIVFPSSASTVHPACAIEAGLQYKYRFTDKISIKLGYEALWLDGVALAPGQIQDTLSTYTPPTVTALGVNAGSSVFFHGADVGLEYSF
jgi:hypothetical protein